MAAAALLTVTASACRSTEQESAQIGREGARGAAAPGALALGAANRGVRVSDVTLLSSGGRTAVAARLTLVSGGAQANVPVLVSVTGKGGKALYSNASGGVESSLQHLALLRPGQSSWWVDDQVLTSQTAVAAKVRVGTGSQRRSGSSPTLATTSAQVGTQAGISVLSANLVNRSSSAQSKVPVFAVGLRGGHVVAAGRAVVGALPGHRGATAPFQIFLVGNAAGAKIELSAVPTGG